MIAWHIAICCRRRIPTNQWWVKLRPLFRILAKHESAYVEEGMYITVEDGKPTDLTHFI